jgi:HAMP domain-containing protein
MRIRTQNLLAIVPIFLGMALINGILAYTTQYQEIRWGINEEIYAITTATAEFLDTDLIRTLKKNPDDERAREKLSVPFNKIKIFQNQQRFFLLYPDDKTIFFRYSTEDKTYDIPKPTIEIDQFKDDESDLVLDGIRKIGENKSALIAYAPIYDRDGNLISILMIEHDAKYFLDRIKNIKNKIFIITGSIVLIGLIAALLISRIINQKINELNKAALIVESGQYDYRVNITTIQEMVDLSNTFNTMSSILGEVLSRTKRTLIEREQFRTHKDLALHFKRQFLQPIEGSFDNVSVSAKIFTRQPTGDFCGVFHRNSGGTYAILGKITVKGDGDIDSVTTGTTAYNFISQELNYYDPQTVFENAREMFELKKFKCLFWNNSSNKIKIYEYRNFTLIEETQELKQNTLLVFDTLSPLNSEKVKFIVKNYIHYSPEELMTDILNMIDDDGVGSLILLSKREELK